MRVLRDLADVDLCDRALVGSKAAVLGALLRRGLPVPAGLVVTDPARWRGACPLESSTGLIARSSAPVEDGARASFAGQFESLGGLRTRASLVSAVRRVSRPCARARAYAARLGLRLPTRIPVLVQRQICATRAGVLFTVDPRGRAPRSFALGWGRPSAVTDGRTGHFCTFDPLAPRAALVPDPVVARALPALVELAFAALAVLSRDEPLDLEWVVGRDGQAWIVQARPVTGPRAAGSEAVERLLAAGWLLVSPRPASRLARHHFQVAARVDRRAARFHAAHFERRVEGGWLLARRVKTSSRGAIEATTPLGFAARFLWRRRRNLAFAVGQLGAWAVARRRSARWAERTVATDLRRLPDRQLDRALAAALRTFDRVRRVHAGLWYPVDLAKDLESFERQCGWPGLSASLPPPARRTARDRETARLALGIRLAHRGGHPRWSQLLPAQREAVLAHLARHPYAFACAAQVQDLSAWRSFAEEPGTWWSQQAALTDAELDALRRAPRPARPTGPPSPTGRLVAAALWRLAAQLAPLKDDRVELLALAAAALRRVLVEVERRAGGDDVDRGWVFELEPAELLALRREPRLREVATARLRRRVLEGFCAPRPAAPRACASAADVHALRGALEGVALSGGSAQGRARVVRTADEARRLLRAGEVLVTEEIRPAFTAVLPRACALVCRRGTPLSHAAIVARELSIPAVSFEDLDRLADGALLHVDGDRGRLRLLARPAAGRVVRGTPALEPYPTQEA